MCFIFEVRKTMFLPKTQKSSRKILPNVFCDEVIKKRILLNGSIPIKTIILYYIYCNHYSI